MAADTNPMASLSSAQLAERLEKSEAGRKKLRQAISILQEKLDAMDKVLKVNDMLRQECEQEKQRAESEKKKAEEEKRLKSLLEKDSATFKDQLIKVLQRLGVVENKQKSDKKEIERLRHEVKLSVEGMRVASQAVTAVQSSFQSLETSLLEKVNAAFEEVHAATEAVKHVQASLQSLEHVAVKQGSSPMNELGLPLTGGVPEKLVDEISRLFNKERQSHCKIEHRLSMLKSVFRVGRRHRALTSGADIVDLESLALSKKKKDKALRKRKSRGEGDVFDRRVRKREDLHAVNSTVNRLALGGHKQVDKDQSMSSPYLIEHERSSDEPDPSPIEPPSCNTASNDYNEEAVVDHRGSSNGNAYVLVPPKEATVLKKENLRDSIAQIVSRGCHKKAIIQNDSIFKIHSEDDCGVGHTRKLQISADQEENPERGFSASRNTANVSIEVVQFNDGNEATNSDVDVDTNDDSEEWWWSNDRILLSPSLPEIPSPLHHSCVPSREPSPCRGFFDSVRDSRVSSEAPVNDASVFGEAAKLQGDAIEHKPKSMEACNNQLDVSMMRTNSAVCDSTFQPGSSRLEKQRSSNPIACGKTELVLNTFAWLGSNVPMGSVQSYKDTSVNLPETALDIGSAFHKACPISDPVSTADNMASASRETCPALDPVPITIPGQERSVVLDNQEVTQFEDFMFEAVGEVPITEINNFLEALPPIPDALQSELCTFDPPLSAPREPVGSACPIDSVFTSIQPQAACEMQLAKASNKGQCEETDVEHAIDQLPNSTFQGLPTQVELCNFEVSRDRESSSLWESSSAFQDTLPSTTKTSSPCEASSLCKVFLLQAFEIHDVDAKVNLTAACIIVNNLESHLRHTNAEKGELQLQAAKLYKTSTDLPLVYVACSIISSAVDLVRSEKGGTGECAVAKPIHVLLQAYVAFIRSIFKEKASTMLNTILAQLGEFLIQGEAMLVTLHGLINPCDDALSVARAIQNRKQCAYQYFEATQEDIYAGGKVLAALCQVLACVTHLQNIVYEVLGWCDKDIMWILTVFSSFSSICGHTAFMVEADDLLGHAICAIITELVASVEQELGKRDKAKISEVTPRPPGVSPKDLVSLAALKEAVTTNGNFSVEQVILAVLRALQHILSSTQNSLLSSFWRTDLLAAKGCNVDETANYECPEMRFEGGMENSCAHQVSTACEIMPEISVESQGGPDLKSLGSRKWQRKYMESVGALELIAQFMGWEWTYNQLIVRYLWKMVSSGSSQILVAGVSHILSILARVASKGGGMDLPGLAELKQHIIHLLQSTSRLMGKAESFLLFDLE